MEKETKKEFSLGKFNELILHESNRNGLISPDIIEAMLELHKIIILQENDHLPKDYCIYDHFTREQIEWYADALVSWPFDSGDGDSGALSHGITQIYMVEDLMKSLSHAKRTKEKGFVFI